MNSRLKTYKTEGDGSVLIVLQKYEGLIKRREVLGEDHAYCLDLLGNYFKDIISSDLDDNIIIRAEQVFTFVYNKAFNDGENLNLSPDLKKSFDEILGILNTLSYTIKKNQRRNRDFFKEVRELGEYLVDTSTLFSVITIMAYPSIPFISFLN